MIDVLMMISILIEAGWWFLGASSLALCGLVWTDHDRAIYFATGMVAFVAIAMMVLFFISSGIYARL